MPKIIQFESESQWLALRSKDVTSTESAALFGMSPYVTEFELYHKKHSGIAPEFEETERMYWGKLLEPVIAQGVAAKLGLNVEPLKVYMRHDRTEGMGSSFDFEVLGISQVDMTGGSNYILNCFQQAFLDRGVGIMEIKNVDRLVYMKDWTETSAPDHIMVQVQHQMEVADRNWTIVVPLVGGNEAKPFIVMRDHGVGMALCSEITRFWDDVLKNREPVPDYSRDAEFVIALHQSSGDKIFDASNDDNISMQLRQYAQLGEDAKVIENNRQAIKAQILDTVGDDVCKVVCKDVTLSCSMTSETPPTIITPEMVGQTIGGRKGFRNFRVTIKKDKQS